MWLGHAEDPGPGRHGENDAAAVKADHPIPPQAGVYYFEVTIVSKGQLGFIGLGFSSEKVALTRLPGRPCFRQSRATFDLLL